MPTYEYLCKCGHQFELRQTFDAPVEMICPNCGQSSSRIVSVPNNIHRWTLSEASYIKGNPMELVKDI